MKILFLDVDGVLNCCGFSTESLEIDKCDLLSNLVRLTGVKIVVSSTWRKYPTSMQKLLGMFNSRGIECLGVTPDLTSSIDHSVLLASVSRYLEIREWLVKHPEVKQYAIVDDDSDADDKTGRYVKTNSYEGLTELHIDKLKKLLL